MYRNDNLRTDSRTETEIVYIEGDALTSEHPLCHCISNDKALGAGIAAQIEHQYGVRQELHKVQTRVGDVVATQIGGKTIFHLITKEKSWQLPRFDDLMQALANLKVQMKQLGVKALAAPRLGAGIDQLPFENTLQYIKDLFKGSGVKWVIHTLPQLNNQQDEALVVRESAEPGPGSGPAPGVKRVNTVNSNNSESLESGVNSNINEISKSKWKQTQGEEVIEEVGPRASPSTTPDPMSDDSEDKEGQIEGYAHLSCEQFDSAAVSEHADQSSEQVDSAAVLKGADQYREQPDSTAASENADRDDDMSYLRGNFERTLEIRGGQDLSLGHILNKDLLLTKNDLEPPGPGKIENARRVKSIKTVNKPKGKAQATYYENQEGESDRPVREPSQGVINKIAQRSDGEIAQSCLLYTSDAADE